MIDNSSILASENDKIFEKILQNKTEDTLPENNYEKKLSDPLMKKKIENSQNKINYNSLKPKKSNDFHQQEEIPEENETDIEQENNKDLILKNSNSKKVEIIF